MEEQQKNEGFSFKDTTGMPVEKKTNGSSKYYTMPLSVTSQFYFCPMPLRMDTYSGCTNNCIYCFANNSNQKYTSNPSIITDVKGVHTEEFVKPARYEDIKKYFDIAFEGKKNTLANQEACAVEALRKRIPIHFGGMSDPFQPKEKKVGITLKVLQLLVKYSYPTIISTKCSLITEEPYKSIILNNPNFGVQVSMIDFRQEVMNILEPGLGINSVEERFKILDTFRDKWTAVRIQPFIIGLTEPVIEEFLEMIKSHGVNHVVVEGLKFMSGNVSANKTISRAFKKITGKEFDLLHHYKVLGGQFSGNDVELPSWRKKEYLDVIKKKCDQLGLTLGSADNDMRFMGDNPCCCGNKDMPGMENVSKHNIGFAELRARERGVPVSYDLIKDEWFWEGDMRLVVGLDRLKAKFGENATYKDANVKLKDLFMEQWNTQGKNSPCQICNLKCNGKIDANGNSVYEFKNEHEMSMLFKPKHTKLLTDF